MNPIFSQLQQVQPAQSTSLSDMANAIKSGKVNPKDEALKILGGMNREQKRRLKFALPAFSALAQKQGQGNNLSAFMQEINGLL